MTDLGTDPRPAAAPAPGAQAHQTWPIAFGGHAGWLHALPDASRAVGVVICSPLGRDARCAHLPMRLLAERLAEVGIPTLRYDHLGSGDSLGLPPDAENALPVWLDGVTQAVRTLKARTGVKQVVLIGLRFGASLAALSRDIADGLVLLAPVVRGGPWLRELKLATAMLAPTTVGATTDDGLDADGLFLTARTVAALSAIDLRGAKLDARPALIFAQNAGVSAFGQTAGASVEPFPGFDALFEDSHSNLPPEAVFEQILAWTTSTFSEVGDLRVVIPAPAEEEAWLFPPSAVERPVTFGPGLRGVLCAPADLDRRSELAVIFGNTGGDPRAGIGGFSTAAARALACEGVASLRFDFAGVGDSPATDGTLRSHVYETPRDRDLKAAADLLTQDGARRVIVGGVCSGGYHALHAALDTPGLAGVFAINTVVLAWRPGASLSVREGDRGRSTRAYLQRMSRAETWRRLFEGRLDLGAVGRTAWRRGAAWLQARSASAPEAAIKVRLAAMTARGGRLWWVVGAEDPALDAVEAHFGVRGRRLTALPGVNLQIEEGLDHGLALSGSREKAQRQLLAFVADLRSQPSAKP